jgi:hypothetical protein
MGNVPQVRRLRSMKLIFKAKRFSCPHRVILVTFFLRYKKKESFYTISKPLFQTPISANRYVLFQKSALALCPETTDASSRRPATSYT